jgi:DNA-binding NarL/FixJ family response regulator
MVSSEKKKKVSRVLIVEDNPTFRQTLRGLLDTRFPFLLCEEAGEGEEAQTKVSEFLPELIFMDIKLPGESGLELTKKIKSSHPEIIIIILTNYDLPEYRDVAMRNGADYFLSKGSSNTQDIMSLVESVVCNVNAKPEKGD